MQWWQLIAAHTAAWFAVSCSSQPATGPTEPEPAKPGPTAADEADAPTEPAVPPEESTAGHDREHQRGHGHHHGRTHEPIGHRFENAEQWAARFDDPQRRKWQRPDEVVRVLGAGSGMAVADIGAGTGYFLPFLSKAVGPKGTVVGLDIERSMVDHMKGRIAREQLQNATARLVTTAEPGLQPASMDRILIVNTWHHIPERPTYARRLKAALKPAGAVAVVDYTLTARRGPPKNHRLPAERVMEELRAGGLEPQLARESLPDQYIVLAR